MERRVLVTGAGGMVGSHMVEYFHNQHIPIIGTYYKPTTDLSDIYGLAKLYQCDVRYFLNIYNIINKFLPTEIYHLAAQSYPTVSWDKPQETLDINIIGTVNVFEAIKMVQKTNPEYNPMVIVACSSAEYGKTLEQLEAPVTEEAPLLPLHPYGVSKVGQDLLSYQYYINFGIRCIRARIFNTTGPRKKNDVCSDFVERIVSLEKYGGRDLFVGNLESKRAITDVRDLVSALSLLALYGQPGEAYNISGKNVYKIMDIVNILRQYAKTPFSIKVEEALLRPSDEKVICGDSQKLIKQTGWQQQYALEMTIADMLEYERERKLPPK